LVQKVLFIVLVQMNFIQHKQFSETKGNLTCFSTNFRFWRFSWMLLWATKNAVAGHMRPSDL